MNTADGLPAISIKPTCSGHTFLFLKQTNQSVSLSYFILSYFIAAAEFILETHVQTLQLHLWPSLPPWRLPERQLPPVAHQSADPKLRSITDADRASHPLHFIHCFRTIGSHLHHVHSPCKKTTKNNLCNWDKRSEIRSFFSSLLKRFLIRPW